MLSVEQIKQEGEYWFPYHHVPVWDGKVFSQTYELSWGYIYLSYVNFILEKVQELGFTSILDVGCGDGRFLRELSKKHREKYLCGIDYSEQAILLAKAMEPKLKWLCGDVTEGIFAGKKFDIVTLIDVIEHIPPEALLTFIQSINKVTSNYLIVSVPSKNVRVSKKHYQHFDTQTLSIVLAPYFKIETTYYLNRKNSFIISVMKRILSNNLFVLNNKFLLSWWYRFYLKHYLIADYTNCKRIVAICVAT